jgi:hypothetical protein
LLGLVSVAACAGRIPRDGGVVTRMESVEAPRRESPNDRIALADLAKVTGRSAGDAVRQLRPEFLRARGRPSQTPSPPSVYVDGRYAGQTEVLELIPLQSVRAIQWVRAEAAKSMLGSYCSCDSGVILLRTRE